MDMQFSLRLVVLVFISIVPCSTYLAGAQGSVGVNYGMIGDNLPKTQDTVAKFKELGITQIRLFDPNSDTLAALHRTNIEVILGTINADINPLAIDPYFATNWVKTHITPHVGSVNFWYISVGNEVIPGEMANDVLPAMKNLQKALRDAGINASVSTAISMSPMGKTYPPSAGEFTNDALPTMGPIVKFLEENNAPLLLNVYPYFAYVSSPQDVKLDYALGNSTIPIVQDGPLNYFSLFHAMVDASYAALEKAGAPNVGIVVSETGWPSAGGDGLAETIYNAQIYNNMISKNVQDGKGTPKRPNKVLETYIFAFFNENEKPQGIEQHFGLFNPDFTPVYPFTFGGIVDAQKIVGVNYGMIGDNLPKPQDTIAKFKELGITHIRLFDPNSDALAAIHGTNIEVILDTINADINPIATDPNFAANWVQTHITPHVGSVNFRYISVGNEVIPGEMANDVLPAMKNLQAALRAVNINAPVSTAISMMPFGNTYPPSAGEFTTDALPIMGPIVKFLEENNAPLLLNVYPYFAYVSNPQDVKLDYALGNSTTPIIQDGPLNYFSLFHAMVDASYAALEKAGAPKVGIVISETGWPSAGGDGLAETIYNAQIYNNVISKNVQDGKGTPKRPNKALETYIFAFFNENQKSEGIEQHFGLFNPDFTPVYPFNFGGIVGNQEGVGVNYGMMGDILPLPDDTIAKFKELHISHIRLFDPNSDALEALHETNIDVILGTLNADINALATNPTFATHWVQTHITPHVGSVIFKYISVGNEVIPGEMANDVLPAMKNLKAALSVTGIDIPISTTISMLPIGKTYPPSAGEFTTDALPIIKPIVEFLVENNAPLLLNVYPYFAYVSNPQDVKLDYALGNLTIPIIQDGPLNYSSLFHAMVDASYAALEKVGAPNVKIVVSETGWPSAGGAGLVETIDNAQTYNNMIVNNVHEGKGTPKRPNEAVETYIFAFFNVNLKPQGIEQHFGLFKPDFTPLYPFTF